MKTTSEDIEILSPKNQLSLFGYEDYFSSFIKLFEEEKLPNSILLSGPKGLGKATFSYHIINYFLSENEEKKYSVENFVINETNLSYKLLNSNTHPNFFLIENNLLGKDIKIEQIRDLLKFLNKTTYTRDLKIVLIDNAENLNLNSSNALLKSIEEPQDNTFFFVIHNNASKILDTVKSRCTEFKFTRSITKKKDILKKITKQYKKEFEINNVMEKYYFETPGNLVQFFLSLDKANISITDNTLKCIFHFIEKYENEKNFESLSTLSLFIEKFYNELCSANNKNLSSYFYNQSKILKKIYEMKKFNLNEKNIFIWIKDILQNEAK